MVINSKNRNRGFFNNISGHYQNLIRKRPLHWMKLIVEPRMGEKVLDVGNGGVREFTTPQTSLYVGVDSSPEMLQKGKAEGIEKVCGEATRLSFRGQVFDTVFYRSLLHHLAGRDFERTMEMVKKALREGSFCLKKNGNVIVIEPCLPNFLERAERILFFISRVFSFLTKQSEVFLFSSETLIRSLQETGYREIKVWKEDNAERNLREWVSPFLGLPFVKIPRWLNPTKRIILEGRKGESEINEKALL